MIRKTNRPFPFSRRTGSSEETVQRRLEIEDVIKHLQDRIDEVIDQINDELASDTADDDTSSALADLSQQISTVAIDLAQLSAEVTLLQAEVATFPAVGKIVTLDNNVPFCMKHYFSGTSTVESGWTGFVPDGFVNDGTLVVDGTLREI